MLERKKDGEPEEFARLRGKIVTACDIAHFNRNMDILREDAKKERITMKMALYIWEKARCPDLTTRSGWNHYIRVYNREMSIEN